MNWLDEDWWVLDKGRRILRSLSELYQCVVVVITVDTWFLDYCSSDWDFDSDDELDAEDIKKEAMIGYFLISFTTIFMTFLIVAYLQSTSIPLCIWTEFEMVLSF